MPRPTNYSTATAHKICTRLMEGEPLRKICLADDMPGESTVYRWLSEGNSEFRELYAHAREVQAHRMLDEIIEIADDVSRDVVQVPDPWKEGETKEIERFSAATRDKLKIDTRKWAMARLAPKIYGDKLALTDGDGKPLPVPEIRIYTGAPPLASSEKEVDDV